MRGAQPSPSTRRAALCIDAVGWGLCVGFMMIRPQAFKRTFLLKKDLAKQTLEDVGCSIAEF